jgi:hypothetical protein
MAPSFPSSDKTRARMDLFTTVRRRLARTASALVVAGASLLLLLTVVGAEPTRASAKILVGEWTGRWKSTAGSTDNVYLVVDTVEGDEVRGTIYVAVATPGQGYYNRDVPFTGSFDGAELRFWVPPSLWFNLKLSGEHLSGSVQGQQTYGTIDLDKRH